MRGRKSCPINNCGECKYSNWFVEPVGKIRCKLLKKVVSSYAECAKKPDEFGVYRLLIHRTPEAQGIYKDCPLKDYKKER